MSGNIFSVSPKKPPHHIRNKNGYFLKKQDLHADPNGKPGNPFHILNRVLAPERNADRALRQPHPPINNIPGCIKQHRRAIKIILQLHLQIFTSIDPMLVPP